MNDLEKDLLIEKERLIPCNERLLIEKYVQECRTNFQHAAYELLVVGFGNA